MTMKQLAHIFLTDPPEKNSFTSTLSGRSKGPPQKDPQSHGAYLRKKLHQAWEDAENEQVVVHAERSGIYLEFKSWPNVELVTKSLEDMRSKKIRLLNVRVDSEMVKTEEGVPEKTENTYATVFVSHEKKEFFFEKIREYAEEQTKSGKPRNANLVNSIAEIRKALSIESFWRDADILIPGQEPEWCEVWLSSHDYKVIRRFEKLLQQQQISSRPGALVFPERVVKVINASRDQLAQLSQLSDDIAEYRRAKTTAAFWTEMENRDQIDWVKDLVRRIRKDDESRVAVCLLDTGVNNGHPLLLPILAEEDCQSAKPEWGVHDHHPTGHGTLMAGIAGYGDLKAHLASDFQVEIRHCLESVKILPIPPDETQPELWGYITSQAVSRAEIQGPKRNRVLCMAVSADDTRDRGRPSSWSAELDKVSSGADDDTRRLIIISVGNLTDFKNAANYPHAQLTDSVHDPGQSWNALTVGAFTELDAITDSTLSGFEPVAPKGGLSPFSTTSFTWEDKWPVKPEIVMEGGNLAQNKSGFTTECDDLSLVSTFFKPETNHFHPFNMTSAATAQAAWLAAQIQASYPEYWPETIRALLIHSAEWPETMKQQFLKNDSKTAYKNLLRICGYGVPDLGRALYSASNSLTLISQNELQPFDKKETGSGYQTNEMHIYEMPWPKEALLTIPETVEVKMRTTLSYFVEPGPGEIGWKDRYRYPSHGLRFQLNSPGESKEEFVKRVNVAARQDNEGHPGTDSASKHWIMGEQARNKGSVHSDIWKGTAAELASSNLIAVFPHIGWWRERAYLNKWNRKTRYALIVTIATPEETIDLYTPVAVQIGITLPVNIRG